MPVGGKSNTRRQPSLVSLFLRSRPRQIGDFQHQGDTVDVKSVYCKLLSWTQYIICSCQAPGSVLCPLFFGTSPHFLRSSPPSLISHLPPPRPGASATAAPGGEKDPEWAKRHLLNAKLLDRAMKAPTEESLKSVLQNGNPDNLVCPDEPTPQRPKGESLGRLFSYVWS